MMALCVRVRGVGETHTHHLVQQGAVCQGRPPQVDPVTPSTTRDNVIDGRKSETLMIKMSMKHDDR